MSSPERTISKVTAAHLAGVCRNTVQAWAAAGRLELDSQGRILREPFERDHCGHILITRLAETINSLPPRNLPSILIEILGSGYLRELGNLVGEKSSTSKRPGEMRSDAPR
jgi:hypothetical protein